jgi:hypothetical protein
MAAAITTAPTMMDAGVHMFGSMGHRGHRCHFWKWEVVPGPDRASEVNQVNDQKCRHHDEWYAARTNDEWDRKFLLRRAQQWTKLAREKEIELRASARTAA